MKLSVNNVEDITVNLPIKKDIPITQDNISSVYYRTKIKFQQLKQPEKEILIWCVIILMARH